MTIINHGIDLVECKRIKQMLEKHEQRFLDRVFTANEQQYCKSPKLRIERLAGRFAVKEAVLKVLGTGWRDGIAWTDIETRNNPAGKPLVTLTGQAKTLAEKCGIDQISISVTHTTELAIASAIALKNEP
jgi:holo-[acyl-carrier protein] synthase